MLAACGVSDACALPACFRLLHWPRDLQDLLGGQSTFLCQVPTAGQHSTGECDASRDVQRTCGSVGSFSCIQTFCHLWSFLRMMKTMEQRWAGLASSILKLAMGFVSKKMHVFCLFFGGWGVGTLGYELLLISIIARVLSKTAMGDIFCSKLYANSGMLGYLCSWQA